MIIFSLIDDATSRQIYKHIFSSVQKHTDEKTEHQRQMCPERSMYATY